LKEPQPRGLPPQDEIDETAYYFIREHNDQAVALREEGELEEAISNYDKVLSIKGDVAVVYNNRGEAQRKQQKYDLAIEDYSRALKINPEFAVAYYNRGLAWCALDRPNQALDDFSRALELDTGVFKARPGLPERVMSWDTERVCRAVEC